MKRGKTLTVVTAFFLSCSLMFGGGTALAGTYNVKAGDTLYKIANSHKITVEELKRANDLTGSKILVGQTLRIPGRVAAASSRGGSYQRTYTQDEWDMLAQVVYGEARGEIYDGQVAVAAVVLNRMESDGFPDTMRGVVFQKNAFTCVSDGQYYLTPDRTAYEAALEAMQGTDPTDGCLYYWNPVTATSRWIWTRSIETQIGNHVFGN